MKTPIEWNELYYNADGIGLIELIMKVQQEAFEQGKQEGVERGYNKGVRDGSIIELNKSEKQAGAAKAKIVLTEEEKAFVNKIQWPITLDEAGYVNEPNFEAFNKSECLSEIMLKLLNAYFLKQEEE